MTANNSLAKLSELVDLGPLNASLNVLFGPSAEHIAITDFFESEEAGILSYTMVLGIKQSFLFNIPGLPAIQLGIVSDNPDEWPLILCEVVVSGTPQSITLRHFPLRVVIDNPILLPIPPEDEVDALAGFSFEIEGTLSVSADLTIKAELESFSLPSFTIAGTGLILDLQDCHLISHADDVNSDIKALGFDQNFRGFYAQSAKFYWDIPFQLNGSDLPGIRTNLENIALGNQGVSVTASLQWDVAFDGNNIDSVRTDIYGELFEPDWQCAIEKLEVVIESNIPIGTSGVGYLRVPFFAQIAKIELGYQYQSPSNYEFTLTLSQLPHLPLDINLGHPDYQLQINDFQLSGQFSSDGDFQLQGQAGLVLNLSGLSVVAESVEIIFEHTKKQDKLLIKLDNIQVDNYGQIDIAQLAIVMLRDDEGDYQLALLELVSEVQWQDISSRITLDDSAALLPMPPNDALVNLNISWSNQVVNFSIKAELDAVDKLWRFIPEAMRPEIDNAIIDIQLTASGGDFRGELGVAFLLRLPDFTQFEALQEAGLSDFIDVESGDENGWMQLRFASEIHTSESGSADRHSAGTISASIENPISIALQLPGLLLPEAPIVIDINKISLELSADGEELTGVLNLEGNFELYPILPDNLDGFVPPMIAMQLDKLLSIAKQLELSGSASLTLGISNDYAYFKAKCIFDQAALELDLFNMLSNALAGSASLFGSEQGNTIDLDIKVSIRLQEVYLQIGAEQPSDSQAIPFEFGFSTLLNFANVVDFPFEFALTQESLSFGLSELSIPLAIPELPLSLADLNQLNDADGNWDVTNNWQNNLLPALETNIAQQRAELDEAQLLLAALQQNTSVNQGQIFQQQYREIPRIQASLFDLAGRKFLYEAILFVFQNVAENSRAIYQQYVEIYQATVDSALGWVSADTQLRFEIEDAKFVLPFNNPSDIRVEGKASIGGVDPSSVFAPLSDLSFKLGISADAIYFAVEGGVNPIPLPDVGGYPGSAVKIDKILIGYGYSKNSLKVDFAGELILSEQLIDAADTSAELGFGFRLPNNSKLGFKLDLIPVVLGEVDFFIPLVAFDIDLTRDFPPPAPTIEGQCHPAWDGLQLIIPGAIRADLKKFKYSPFFGPIPAVNAAYAFDLDIGNQNLGLQHIADYSIIMPILGTLPIPFLMDGAPFFQRLCSNIQLGGFSLSFDLTRPFPHPSPLLIFELLGFISDPDAAIDPNGHIANLMYAELFHGKISLPPPVLAMFPALGGVVNTNFSGKINVATIIAIGQNIQTLAQELINKLENNAQQTQNWLEDTVQNPPLVNITNLLALLPLEMRLIHLPGRLVHFDADATFILSFASDINQQLGEPGITVPEPPPAFELVYRNDFKRGDLRLWKNYDYGLKRGKGHWYINGGKLVQDNNVGDNSPARYGAMLVYNKVEVGDFRLFLQTQSTDNDGLGVVFHLQSKNTFYRFRMTEEQNEWRLDKLRNGDIDTLFSTNTAFTQNQSYKIRIDVSSKELNPVSSGLLQHSPFNKKRFATSLVALTPSKHTILMQTRIKVWVNGQLWCDVRDDLKPLISGKVGVDSWWNNGAYFDNFELFKPTDANVTLGTTLTAKQLVPLNRRLAGTDTELADFFTEFSAQHISAALADSGDFAVTMKASIKVFEHDLLSMLGSINSDGRFSLLSASQVKPFTLSVVGIDVPIPFEAATRISLVGQKSGANSFAILSASVFADWIILPGPTPEQAIARVLLGTQETPIDLLVTSDIRFSVKGQGELRLFSEQVIIDGLLDISQAHMMITGELNFSPIIEAGGQRVVGLTASIHGRIGPNDFVEILGEGQLKLFGKPFIASDIKIADQLIELSASTGIFGHDNSWLVGDLPIINVQMALSGRVDFSQQTPVVALQGKGNLDLFGAGIDGNIQLEIQGDNWLLSAKGNMSWLGRDWLSGSMLLSNTGAQLQGHAEFTIPLTASQLGAGLQIAGLLLKASISGKFKLNNLGQLVHWDLTVDWQLAVQLPGMDNNKQNLPIASQQIKVNGIHGGSEELLYMADLVNFSGITLFDFQGLSIPVPQFDNSESYAVYIHDSVDLGVEPIEFNYLIFDLNPSDGFEEGTIRIEVPEIPIPIFSDRPQNTNDAPLFKVPKLTLSTVPLGKFRLEDQFNLKLAWKTGQLGVSTTIDGTQHFYEFEALSSQISGIISIVLPLTD